MNLIFQSRKVEVFAIIVAVLLFCLQLVWANIVLGAVGFVIIAIVFTRRIFEWYWLGASLVTRFIFGWMAILSVFIASLTGIYFAFELLSWIPVLVLAFLSVGVFIAPSKFQHFPVIKIRWDINTVPVVLVILADVAIIFLLMVSRTDAAIISPWNIISGGVFVMYFMSSLILLWLARTQASSVMLGLGILHTFVSVSVSVIVYGIGFGFDPFIHRAAEKALIDFGSINPRQLLYSGQYVTVAALHHLTSIPIKVIDIWLVPAMTAIFLPLSSYFGLRYGFKISERKAAILWIFILSIPYMLLTFTVPFTATYLFFILVLFLIPATRNSLPTQIILLLTAMVSLAFHPLIALPYIILIVGFILIQLLHSWNKIYVALGVMLLTAISIPSLMIVYQTLQGQEVVWGGVSTRIGSFVSLFLSPYVDRFQDIPMYLDILYGIRYWLPMLVVPLGIVGMILFLKRHKDIVLLYMSFAVGLMGAIFGLSTMFVFKDIIQHEQLEFALRLLQSWYLIFLPFVIVAVAQIWQKKYISPILKTVLALLITISWYFSYPQVNSKYSFFAPSVGAVDIETVNKIDEIADGEYLVLSNQMTSAAALQEFGFRDYYQLSDEQVLWYAIPTGGELYAYYSRIIFEGGYRNVIDELQSKTLVKEIYFVMHNYWQWRPDFVEQLESSADEIISINKEEVIILRYKY